MSDTLKTIMISRIRKPRISLRPIRHDSPEYEELVGSIRIDGVLQPILVRPCDDPEYDYEVVEGWHRLTAAREVGLTSIPCMIREMDDDEVLIVQIKCNAIRPVTRTFEYARRLMLLMRKGYTLPELSALIDKTPRWIENQLQLNRVCPEARPAVERGEIKMTAALALANLPVDLQPKFVDDAIALPANQFADRAKAAKRDFQEFLLQERQTNKENGAATPALRTINALKRESVKPNAFKAVCDQMGAKTPRDGWVACLAWMFKLDPISVENRKAGNKETEDAKLVRRQEWRELNREMIAKFVNPESSIGDYRNGK